MPSVRQAPPGNAGLFQRREGSGVGAVDGGRRHRAESGDRVGGAAAVDPRWLEGVSTLGVTAGASAPESVVEEVVARIAELADIETETIGDIVEQVCFNLPRNLRPASA